MPLLATAPLNAVFAPLLLVSAVAPVRPVLRSQARKVRPPATVPFQLALGTKRTEVLASAASRRAEPSLTAPNASQLLPPSRVYCQAPLRLSTAVTAMPVWGPSTSVTCTGPPISADTSVPGLPDASSRIVVRLLAPASTGASLTAATVMPLLALKLLKAVLPPCRLASALPPALPLL